MEKQTLQWFYDRINKYIYRKKSDTEILPIKITDKRHAHYLYYLNQKEGHEYFEEK